MRILIVSDHPYLPERVGGRESSIHAFANLLLGYGDDVTVYCLRRSLKGRAYRQLQRWWRGERWQAQYPIIRKSNLENEFPKLLNRKQFDSIFFNLDTFQLLDILGKRSDQRYNLPVIFIHDADAIQEFDNVLPPNRMILVSVSKFLADRILFCKGRKSHIVYPLVDYKEYETITTAEYVTFINPIAKKGLDVALMIAELLPSIQFFFVESWPLTPFEFFELKQKLSSYANVQLAPPFQDMKRVYGRTKILLAPSECEEAFGRVVVEAQASGIPTVTSSRGGLPEAVGNGGLVLDYEASPTVWASAIERLWLDQEFYSQMSLNARRMAEQHFNEALNSFVSLREVIQNEISQMT